MKKNTNTIYGIAVIAIFVFGLIMLVGPGKGGGSGAVIDQFSVGETSQPGNNSFDFGSVSMSAGKVSHSFSLKNDNGEELVINKIYTSCMCTEAIVSVGGKTYGPFGMAGHGFLPSINAGLAPGESAEVKVVFDPAAHGPAGIGRIERLVYVENGLGSPITFKIAATVIP